MSLGGEGMLTCVKRAYGATRNFRWNKHGTGIGHEEAEWEESE
jgi:hypothetical protein